MQMTATSNICNRGGQRFGRHQPLGREDGQRDREVKV
jgi:hypothetical protein